MLQQQKKNKNKNKKTKPKMKPLPNINIIIPCSWKNIDQEIDQEEKSILDDQIKMKAKVYHSI